MAFARGPGVRSGVAAIPTRSISIPLARLASLLAIAAFGCATDASSDAAREAAYQQCLKDNMAVAMAWEMIEASCREETGGGEDPLGAKKEDER